jgi:hypothetical protein
MRWEGHVVRMGEMRNAYSIVIGKPEGKDHSGKRRRKLEDNIRMDLREIEWEGMDLMHMAQDVDQWRALVNTVMNFLVS